MFRGQSSVGKISMEISGILLEYLGHSVVIERGSERSEGKEQFNFNSSSLVPISSFVKHIYEYFILV